MPGRLGSVIPAVRPPGAPQGRSEGQVFSTVEPGPIRTSPIPADEELEQRT
jgi:hypothetical protein